VASLIGEIVKKSVCFVLVLCSAFIQSNSGAQVPLTKNEGVYGRFNFKLNECHRVKVIGENLVCSFTTEILERYSSQDETLVVSSFDTFMRVISPDGKAYPRKKIAVSDSDFKTEVNHTFRVGIPLETRVTFDYPEKLDAAFYLDVLNGGSVSRMKNVKIDPAK
jgi:hypothetical protein